MDDIAVLEREMVALRERVNRLEWAVWPLPQMRPVSLSEDERPVDRENLVTLLKRMGIVRDRLPEEEALAEEWRRLPAEEKQAHTEYMRSLALDPPLSQIIIENRR